MELQEFGLLLSLLTLLVVLNVFMTLRLATIVGAHEHMILPFSLSVGTRIPRFLGRRLIGGEAIDSESLLGNSSALIFLSPGCDDCKKRLAELEVLYEGIRRSRLNLLVFGTGSKRGFARMLRGSRLAEHAVLVDPGSMKALNPRNAAPFYIFSDENAIVLASSFIGDEDWESFRSQIEGDDFD